MNCIYPKESRMYKMCIGCSNQQTCKATENLPSAYAANQMTKNHLTDIQVKELSEVVGKINKAINNGEFSFAEDGILPGYIRKKLEKLGYKITTGSQYNQEYYEIDWRCET